MWSASALLGLRCPSLWYWSLVPHAGQCVIPIACALASTCFLNCLCSLVLVLLTVFPLCSLLFALLFRVGVRWWRVAASARRAPPPSNTTLLSLFVLSLFVSRSSSFCLWYGVCCVVRAQLCEHARNTTHALLFLGLFVLGICVLCCVHAITHHVCCPHHMFTVNVHSVHH